jgi:lipopolysaccharide export system permease protein
MGGLPPGFRVQPSAMQCRLPLRPNHGGWTTKLPQLGLIDRYLMRSIAAPLFGTLVIAAMLLVLDKMLRLFQYVVDAGGPVSVVWRMLANLLPEYLALGIPIGLMLGILLAFRKLALSSELDALRGIGIGYGRLLRIPYAYTVPLAIINLFIVGYLEPYTHYRYEGLRFDLKSGALGAAIKVGEFNQLGKHLTLRIDRSEKKGTLLHGIFVQNEDGKGMTIAATAERGRFLATDDPDKILFRLTKGRLVQDSPKFATPRTLAFDSYDLPISLPVIDQFRRRAAGETDELYLHELWRLGYGGGAPAHAQRMTAEAHFNFRMVEVMMMFMLPLLAVALAVPPKRSSSGLGIFVSILIVVAYHKVNQYADQAAAHGRLNPTLGLWVPLVLLSVLIIWMYHVLAHRPGGQPIGALERFFSVIGKRIRGMMTRAEGSMSPA